MKENRESNAKLTIRCSEEKAQQIRELQKSTKKTLCELLVDTKLMNSSVNSKIPLNLISKQCSEIENLLTCKEDVIIFKEGMENIWKTLLKM